MKTSRHLFGSFALGVLALGQSAGCVEPPTDINRVQPGYVDKDVFSGEWYIRHLVVDKQFQTSAMFIGYEGGLDRIRWEITQDFLIAYRSYERVPGTEGANGGEETVLAMYPIRSHFDIRRNYNPVNGTPSNVIAENTMDRPWWERDYIRVNWHQNTVPDWDLNGAVRAYASPMAGAQTENNDGANPADPWKVRVVENRATGEVDYIELTSDVLLDVDPWACIVSAGDWYANCGGGLVRLKTSFRKMDPAHQYEPLNYPDFMPLTYGVRTDPLTGSQTLCFEGDEGCEEVQELWLSDGPLGTEICDPEIHDPDNCFVQTTSIFSRFGFFRTDRFAYDRENGYTLTGRERLINRWNIWEKSYDDNGQPLPYASRTPKPIVYYMNVNFPDELFGAVQDMADDWDVAFRDTVAALQGKSLDEIPRMYEVRENTCNIDGVNAYVEGHKALRDLRADLTAHGIGELGAGNLENACAVLEHYSALEGWEDAFTWEQLGDLRYSFVTWLKKAEIAGPLGYGPSAADPVTGEIISANANIYGASLDVMSNTSADYVQFINGELSEGDVINGTNVREHIESVRARYREDLSPETVTKFMQLFDERTGGMSDAHYLRSLPFTGLNENLDKIAETGFEEQFLLDAETLQLFGGVSPQHATDPSLITRARPSVWGRDSLPAHLTTTVSASRDDSMTAMQGLDVDEKMSAAERFQRRVDYLGRQNFCYLEEQMEPALADLAAELAQQNFSRDEIVQLVREQVLRAVLAHEVGHTLGLRHNFEGSTDALNFFPEYWDVDLGDDHRMANNPRRNEVEYSSIMDYHQRFNSDWAGIGLYDKAAIKFGYGQLVEVFDEGRFDPVLNLQPDPFVPRSWDRNLSLFNPSDLPYLLAGGATNDILDNLYDEVYAELVAGDPNVFVDVKSTSIQPRPENLYKRRNISFAELRKQEAMRVFPSTRNEDGSLPLVAVPYSYCSDAYAWGGNLTCNRWDKGATSQEIVRNAAEMYDFYYPFRAFRGERLWDYGYYDPVNSYIGGLFSRTYQPMLTAFRYFYYYRRSTASIWPLIRDWSAASYDGMNFFGRVLQTPEPGRYCLQGEWYVPEDEAEAGACDANAFTLPMGDARFFETKWTAENDLRPQRIGHIWDKLIAIQAMTSSNAFFFRDFSNFFSRGAFNIGYYRVFQPEMLRLYNGLILQDRDAYAPRVQTTGTPTLVFQPLVQFGGELAPQLGAKLKPTDSYNMRYYAMLFAMANFTSSVDFTLDFANRSRISLVGSNQDPVIDPSIPEVTFTDPNSHFSYRATAPDGAELSLGYRLVEHAADLVNDGANGEPAGTWYTAKVAWEDAVATGTPAEAQAAETAFRAADRQLNQWVQLLDQVRQLADLLE